MKRNVRLAVGAVVLAVVAGLVWLAWAPRVEDARTLSGYVEGEALYLASPISGPLAKVAVVRGQRVAAGDQLFAMDPRTISAQRSQSVADVAQTTAQITSAEASLRQLEAAADAARAVADNAAVDARRFTALRAAGQGAVSQQDADRAVATAASTAAQARAATAQAAAASSQIAATRQLSARAAGGLTDVSTRLGYLAPVAPGPARVEEVFFQTGEWAGANQPIVSLLPDAKVKVRFYVPEKEVNAYRPGTRVQFSCDGCAKGMSAEVAYVSPRPEYTPPVIYSRKTRDSLVFLVEARPADPTILTPGQPVDVIPLTREGVSK